MTERSERSKRISAGMRLHWANRRTLALARLAGQAETMPAMEAALREIHGIATHSLCETWDEDANAMMRICSVVERALPVKQESDHGTREWCQRCSEPKPLPAPQHPLALIAWHDALIWAVKNPKILAAFQLETGAAIPAPCGGILAMIDKACGLDEVFAGKFISFFNENIWGVENGKPVDFGGEVPAASESEGAA